MSPNPDHRLDGQHENDEDELAIFGGQTRVLISKLVSKKSTSSRTKSTSSQPTTPPTSHSSPAATPGSSSGTDSADIHPTLVEYLSLFPLTSYTPGASMREVFGPSPADFSETSTFTPQAAQVPPPTVSPPSSSNDLYFSYDSFFNPMLVGTVQQSMTPPGDNIESSPEGLMDLGIAMAGESHVDEQWMSFMRDSGFLDRSNVAA